jgi:hypothetical protein
MLSSRAEKGPPGGLAMRRFTLALSLLANHLAWAAPREVAFSQSAASVAAYDFVEVSLHVSAPVAGNPFTEAEVTGWFGMAGTMERVKVDGFCDSADGTVFRIRFMPSKPGDYTYTVKYADKGFEKSYDGTFHATAGGRRGPIRVDPEHRWHFIWEGTGEHYFFHGTTAFWLMGWRDERVIGNSLERLRRLKVNRVRVLLSGRTNTMYGEPAMNTAEWSLFLSPWPAVKADDFYHPGFDYARFRVEHWQRFERMLRYARERDIVISVILDIADGQIHLAPGSEDERRYIRYATARLAAFSNITWDLGDDLDTFRNDQWAHETGALLESWDPYRHLATTHPVHREHQDRGSEWFGFTSIPPFRIGRATNMRSCWRSGNCRSRQAASFPRPTKSTAMRTTIRCGRRRRRAIRRRRCGGRRGTSRWPAPTARRVRRRGAAWASGRIRGAVG